MEGFAGWTHGNSVIAQTPSMTIERLGFWAHVPFNPFDDPPEAWFHFAVPTPTVIQGHQASFKRAMVLFHTELGCAVDQIDVWHGKDQLDSSKEILQGDYMSRVVDGENAVGWPMSSPRSGPDVLWGIGISVHVVANHDAAGPGTIDFVGAGVDLEADV